MTAGGRRGRPADGTGGDRRSAILNSARTLFAAHGFAGTTLRSIAADADVDVALIAHYFGSKRDLLFATLELPFNPMEKIASALADGFRGEHLVQTFLESWDPHREVVAVILRSATNAGADATVGADTAARDVIIPHIAQALHGPDRDLRASLIASTLIGLAITRYVIAVEPVASAPVRTVVAAYAPSLDSLLHPETPPAPTPAPRPGGYLRALPT